MTPEPHLWHRRITIFGRRIFIGACLALLGAPAGFAATAESDPATTSSLRYQSAMLMLSFPNRRKTTGRTHREFNRK